LVKTAFVATLNDQPLQGEKLMDDLDDNQPEVEENDIPSPDDDGEGEGEGGPGGGDEDATWTTGGSGGV
jgi:hypothetical protein